MKAFSLPASTVTTALAGAITTCLVWAVKAFAHVDVPIEVAGAIATIASVAACHWTQDAPPGA